MPIDHRWPYAYGNVKDAYDNYGHDKNTGNLVELNDETLIALGNPVKNPPFNNWSVNQPSAPHDSGMSPGNLGLKNMVIDGVNGFDFVQTNE